MYFRFVDMLAECVPACANGGTCLEGQCLCPDEFTGASCEIGS